MKISKTILPAAALVALFAGCQDENMGVTSQEVRRAKYAQEFKEVFGDIDPNQDWSMAKQVTATVSGVEDGTLEIFYKNPIASDAVILARKEVVGGQATVTFDMNKAVNRVYVRIKKGNKGYYPLCGYFNVVDGEVDFSSTRAAVVPSGESRVVKGEAETLLSNVLNPEKAGDMELYTGDAPLAVDWIDGYYRENSGQNHPIWRNYSGGWYAKETFTNIIPLSNVLSTEDERPEVYVSDIAHFFMPIDGEKPLFTESENHVKYMKEGSTPQLRKNLVFTMASESPMYLDYFFKGTKYTNKFGYFYYKGSNPTPEQFKTMPKYVLIDNMTTEEGKVTYAEGEKDWDLLQVRSFNASAQSDLISGINGLVKGTGSDVSIDQDMFDSKIIGTRIPLTYFGDDYSNTTGSYEFPEGTKIGLFILGYTQSGRSDNGTEGTIITSIADLNLKLYGDVPHAASFSINDNTVFSMEDMLTGSDFDLNDVMFFVNGDFEEEEEEITPPATPEAETWIAACEDLGGAFDYDFNDIVFGLKKTIPGSNGKSDLIFIPLAAGGTMQDDVYFNGEYKGEIHNMLAGTDDVTAALNVTAKSAPAAGAEIVIAQGIDGALSINTLMQYITIKATKADDPESTTEQATGYNLGFNFDKKLSNNAPQVLLLPQGWGWPSEETTITTVYPGFKNWAGDLSDVAWIDNIADEDLIVTNPIPKAVPVDPGSGGGGSGSGGGGSTEPVVGDLAWDITLTGPETIELGSTATYTATVAGLTDFTGLTVSNGSYSSGVAGIKDGSLAIADGVITFQVEGKVAHTATIYVKVTGDATHRDTRKEMHITVTKKIPTLVVSTTGMGIAPGESAQFNVSMPRGNANLQNWSVTCKDTDIATVGQFGGVYSGTTVTGVAKGTTTITVHYPGDAEWASMDATIVVYVGTVSYADPIEIPTSSIGESIYLTPTEWQKYELVPVDLSALSLNWPIGGKLTISGNSNNIGLIIYDKDKNVIKYTYTAIYESSSLVVDVPNLGTQFYIGGETSDINSKKIDITGISLEVKTVITDEE